MAIKDYTADHRHPLLNEQNTIELDGIKFTQTQTNNYQKRFRAFSSMQQLHIETILRHLNNGKVHRTTTFFNKKGQITNRISKTIENVKLDNMDRRNVKTIIQNYMTNQAQYERR